MEQTAEQRPTQSGTSSGSFVLDSNNHVQVVLLLEALSKQVAEVSSKTGSYAYVTSTDKLTGEITKLMVIL